MSNVISGICAAVGFYVIPAILCWFVTRAFMKQHNKTPSLSDALFVFCPGFNLFSLIHYLIHIEANIDTSKFFRLGKVKK